MTFYDGYMSPKNPVYLCMCEYRGHVYGPERKGAEKLEENRSEAEASEEVRRGP